MNTIFMLTLQQTATQGNAFMAILTPYSYRCRILVLYDQTTNEETKRIEKVPGRIEKR